VGEMVELLSIQGLIIFGLIAVVVWASWPAKKDK
jgi:cbb3-type cytochrome oxidase subunit 3